MVIIIVILLTAQSQLVPFLSRWVVLTGDGKRDWFSDFLFVGCHRGQSSPHPLPFLISTWNRWERHPRFGIWYINMLMISFTSLSGTMLVIFSQYLEAVSIWIGNSRLKLILSKKWFSIGIQNRKQSDKIMQLDSEWSKRLL